MNTLTNKGYTTAKQLDKCVKNGITPYSSPMEHSSQHNGLYPMKDFVYNQQQDTDICPAGETLITNGSVYNKANHKVKHYKTKAYKGCARRNQCNQNKNGRFIERSIYQEALYENKKKSRPKP
jgi:hypothetical protein